jgi:hypothetical protein
MDDFAKLARRIFVNQYETAHQNVKLVIIINSDFSNRTGAFIVLCFGRDLPNF